MMHESVHQRRFWSRVSVNETTGCWEWTASHHPRGYGHARLADGRWVYAHRYAYELLVGPIPDGLSLDHLCRNTACCNPTHLEPVTQRVNVRRSPLTWASRNGNKTHCIRGHEFTPENTVRVSGGRRCRECHNARRRITTAASQRPAA